VATGLLSRSFINAQRVDVGADVDRIAVLATNLARGGVTPQEQPVVADAILERIAALPGVDGVALTSRLPVEGGLTASTVVEGYVPPAGTGSLELQAALVSPTYFATMGIPVLSGRTFAATDRAGAPIVAVVNETAARLYWPNGEAGGGRVRPQDSPDAWMQVVGVVADVKVAEATEAPTPMIYYSIRQRPLAEFDIVARTSGDPAALLNSMRRALNEVRATLPVTRQMTLAQHVAGTLDTFRTWVAVLNGFSLLGLLLATLGVYAAVSFNVERRTQEMGVRVALGATYGHLVQMVLRQSLAVAGAGVVVGLGMAALATRGLRSLLFGVGPLDAATFAAAAAVILLAAAAAAFLPARRAARADAVETLRTQ
jgi:predicted permease